MTTHKILIIAETESQTTLLTHHLKEQHHFVTTMMMNDDHLMSALISSNHTIVIFSMHQPSPSHIQWMHHIQQHAPKSVIVFTDKCNDTWIKQAINVGANSIVVNDMQAQRIDSIIEIAIARFQRCMVLRSELSDTKQKLEERRDIDRAKGILMKTKNIDEAQSYQLLRKMAMDKNKRIGEIAYSVITAAELLNS